MQRSEIDNRLINDSARISQIIVGAMVLGVVMFLAVVLLRQNPPAAEQPVQASTISYLAAAMFVGGVCISLIVPGQMVNAQVAKLAAMRPDQKSNAGTVSSPVDGDSAKLLQVFQSKTIAANALLEGPAFFATCAYMIERQSFTVAIAVAAAVLMLATFPTRARVKDWLQSQQDRIDGIRQFGGTSF